MRKIKKFFIVGLISTIIDYFIYSVLIYFGINYNLAICIGYISGFIVNFILVRNYVFDFIKTNSLLKEISIVFIISTLGLILNILIVNFFFHILNVNLYISRIIAIGIVFFYNYFMRKGVIYG